jgi:choline kinase
MISIIILAAGCGRRLGINKPKCLIEIGGRTLLSRMLGQIYDWYHFSEVIVVTGFQHEMLEDALFRQGAPPYNLKTIFNPNFDTMGTKESLYWGLTKASGDEVIILESDIIFTNLHLAAVLHEKDSVVVASPMNALDDKVYVYTNEKGIINRMSKEGIVPTTRNRFVGEFVGITRVRKTNRLVKLCSSSFDCQDYESVLVKMKLRPQVTDHRWQEIDTPEHLAYAKECEGIMRWNIDI